MRADSSGLQFASTACLWMTLFICIFSSFIEELMEGLSIGAAVLVLFAGWLLAALAQKKEDRDAA